LTDSFTHLPSPDLSLNPGAASGKLAALMDPRSSRAAHPQGSWMRVFKLNTH